MSGPDPAEYAWWLTSRAAGIAALLCMAASVGLGLAMAGRVSRRPALARTLLGLHQHTALAGLVAIAVHGIALLGDAFLRPGLVGIAVPFVIEHERAWTGLGVVGGWLAAILGLSYWIRDRIGPGLWRRLHRATLLVYVLSVAHTLGSGSDAGEPWMQVLVVLTGAPVLFLFVMRILPARQTPPPAPRGLRPFRVTAITPESADVTSFRLEPADGGPVPAFLPGQFVTMRVEVPGRGPQMRSYSLSGAPGSPAHRISVKRAGLVSGYLHEAVGAGDVLQVGEPAGAFVLADGLSRPVALISAGVGATPVLSMLHSLAAAASQREVWWVHGARCGREHPFRQEARDLVERLPQGRGHVRYSRPEPRDVMGRDFDAAGRVTAADLLELGVPREADFHLCGPTPFVEDVVAGLRRAGVPEVRIRSESFGGAPAPPAPAVAFARSGVETTWESEFATLLELAEARDVAAPSGCRVGACHGCRVEVLNGRVRHEPEPVQPPPAGSALLCCARPEGDVVLNV